MSVNGHSGVVCSKTLPDDSSNSRSFMSATKAPPDRRIVRTREALRSALVELILEKGYDAIAVNDIVTRAHVARSTFYAHHGSKESVLLDGIGNLREFLAQAQRAAREAANGLVDPLGFTLAFFEHADDSRDLSRALLGSGGGVVMINAFRQMFDRLVRRGLIEASDPKGKATPIPLDALVRFTTEALMGVLMWWIEVKPRLSPLDGNRIFRQLIDPTLVANGFLTKTKV